MLNRRNHYILHDSICVFVRKRQDLGQKPCWEVGGGGLTIEGHRELRGDSNLTVLYLDYYDYISAYLKYTLSQHPRNT